MDKQLEPILAVNRFGIGAKPGEIAAATTGAKSFLKAQIQSGGARQPTPYLGTTAEIIAEYLEASRGRGSAGLKSGAAWGRRQEMRELSARVELQLETLAGFQERWVMFWLNHFTVSVTNPRVYPLVGAFEREAVRPHVFGEFECLLDAVSHHPAMLIYLNNDVSIGPDSAVGRRTGRGLNENFSREIMELHTIGLRARYTQEDVIEFARALTGWQTGLTDPSDMGRAFVYRGEMHQPGIRRVLGRDFDQNGEEQGRAILHTLAHHPSTALHIAEKLAKHFVSDDPPRALVARLSSVFQETGGALHKVAEALIEAPEAWAPEQTKLKSPYDFLISASRLSDFTVIQGRSFAQWLKALGQAAYSAPQPNGWPDESLAWGAPALIMARMAWSQHFAGLTGGPRDPLKMARDAIGVQFRDVTADAMINAANRQEALAILLMSPEFQRR